MSRTDQGKNPHFHRPRLHVTSSDVFADDTFFPFIAAAAEENIGMDLDENVSGSRMSLELDFGSLDDGDLGVRLPERGYHPRGRR